MRDTKQAILSTALHLFAADGYEAVSVSQIAGALGMGKSALYKHFRNKRDIFDQIVARMEQMDAAQAAQFGMPEGTPTQMPEQYSGVTPEQLVQYSMAQFRYWTEDDFAASFRKMLTLEQYRSIEMQQLYQQYLAGGPTGYVADLLRAMGLSNPRELAASYYGIMFLYYSLFDVAQEPSAVTAQLEAALANWVRQVWATKEGETP